jgi:hypothetical protein
VAEITTASIFSGYIPSRGVLMKTIGMAVFLLKPINKIMLYTGYETTDTVSNP